MRILVGGLLEFEDESRRALDFVDDEGVLSAHEADGIVFGEAPELVVVEGDEGAAVVVGDAAGERGLAGLARADDGDDACIGQRRANPRLGMADNERLAADGRVRHGSLSGSDRFPV